MIFYWDIINQSEPGKVTLDICTSNMRGSELFGAFMLESHIGWDIQISIDNFSNIFREDIDTKSDAFLSLKAKHKGDFFAALEEVLFTEENIKKLIQGIFK